MKINILLLILTLTSCLNDRERVITLKYDNGTVKQEKIYDNKDKDSTTYSLLQYNPDGSLEMEGKIENGLEQGLFIWYYANGNKKWVESFENGVSIDTVYCFYESGIIKRLNHPPVNFRRQSFEYYESGELKISTFINNGKYIDSIWTGYYKNGNLKENGFLKNGNKNGYWYYYNENGILIDSINQTGESKEIYDFEVY